MKWFLLLGVVFLSACVSSQSAIYGTAYLTTCSGNPDQGGPLSCAHSPASVTVVLLANNTVVNSTMSAANGSFLIHAEKGEYMLCIQDALYSCRLFTLNISEEKKVDLYTLPLPSA